MPKLEHVVHVVRRRAASSCVLQKLFAALVACFEQELPLDLQELVPDVHSEAVAAQKVVRGHPRWVVEGDKQKMEKSVVSPGQREPLNSPNRNREFQPHFG